MHTVLIREIIFADNTALNAHSEHYLQKLFSQFNHACKEFGLTINIQKTSIMGHDVSASSSIKMVLEVPDHLTYLGSIITNNLSLDMESDKCIAKAAAVMAKLSQCV